MNNAAMPKNGESKRKLSKFQSSEVIKKDAQYTAKKVILDQYWSDENMP